MNDVQAITYIKGYAVSALAKGKNVETIVDTCMRIMEENKVISDDFLSVIRFIYRNVSEADGAVFFNAVYGRVTETALKKKLKYSKGNITYTRGKKEGLARELKEYREEFGEDLNSKLLEMSYIFLDGIEKNKTRLEELSKELGGNW